MARTRSADDELQAKADPRRQPRADPIEGDRRQPSRASSRARGRSSLALAAQLSAGLRGQEYQEHREAEQDADQAACPAELSDPAEHAKGAHHDARSPSPAMEPEQPDADDRVDQCSYGEHDPGHEHDPTAPGPERRQHRHLDAEVADRQERGIDRQPKDQGGCGHDGRRAAAGDLVHESIVSGAWRPPSPRGSGSSIFMQHRST